MQNSHGPAVPQPELSGQIVGTIRLALADVTRPSLDRGELRDAVSALAHRARALAVTPERLIVALKHAWASEPAEHAIPDRRAHLDLFDQSVSLFIREYFA